MSTMTLIQQLRGRAEFLRDKGRIKSPQLMEQAADALAHLSRQPEVSEEVTPEILAVAVCARNKEYNRAQQAGEPRNEGLETLAALTAVWHNRPAQEAPEGHSVRVMSSDGEWEGEARWEHQERAYVTQEAVRASQEKAEPVAVVAEVSKLLTDAERMGYMVDTAIPLDTLRSIREALTAPPAERARVPADAEAVSACLGDDAAAMLETNAEDERALNMQRAAQIIDSMLSAAPEASSHG